MRVRVAKDAKLDEPQTTLDVHERENGCCSVIVLQHEHQRPAMGAAMVAHPVVTPLKTLEPDEGGSRDAVQLTPSCLSFSHVGEAFQADDCGQDARTGGLHGHVPSNAYARDMRIGEKMTSGPNCGPDYTVRVNAPASAP